MVFNHRRKHIQSTTGESGKIDGKRGPRRIKIRRDSVKFPVNDGHVIRNGNTESVKRGIELQRVPGIDADECGASVIDGVSDGAEHGVG